MGDGERIEKILADWYEGRDEGAGIDPEEVIRAHPELAEELRIHFDAMEAIGRAFAHPLASPVDAPTVVADFRILREVGRGGNGVVYEAEQISMGRRVALKVLSPVFTGSRQTVARFKREARAAGQLHHTNIVPVYAMGEEHGLSYYAMELVDGPPLGDVITRMRGPTDGEEPSAPEEPAGEEERLLRTTPRDRSHFLRLAEMAAGVAEGLHAAHEEGIVHRDVKPANLLLSSDGTLKLVDFGLARLTGEGTSMTVTGQIIGTPYYMSPEQATARKVRVDHRSDVYSLGATLYELLTLRPPFRGDSIGEVCSKIIAKDPTPPRKLDPKVPRDLETIVQKAMEKAPDKRYQTAEEMARDLRRFAEGVPIRARRIGPVGRTWRKVKRRKVRTALIAAVLLLAAVGFGLARWGAREAAYRHEHEYAELCGRAQAVLAVTLTRGLEPASHRLVAAEATSRELFNRAVALEPERRQAYLGRALSPGGTIEKRLEDLDTARRLGLPDRTWHLARALLYEITRDYGKAAEERTFAGSAEPANPEDAYLEANLLGALGMRAEARELLSRVIKGAEGPSTIRNLAYRSRARFREQDGDYAGAIGDLSALGDEHRFDTRVTIAHLWWHLCKKGTSKEIVEAMLDEVGKATEPTPWLRLVRACPGCKEWKLRPRVLDEAVRRFPDSLGLLLERVDLLADQGDLESALDLSESILSADDENHRAHEARGNALLGLKRYAEAEPALRSALRLDPQCPHALRGLSVALWRIDRIEEAVATFDQAARLGLRTALIHKSRGLFLSANLERLEESLPPFERALELEPDDPETHRGIAGALLSLGRHREGLDHIDRALELDSGDPWARSFRVAALLGLGKVEDAYESAKKLVADEPGFAMAHFQMGKALERKGDYANASDAFREALRHSEQANPVNICQFHCGLGHALMKLGRHAEALEAIEEGLTHKETDFAFFNRAIVLGQLGKFDEAFQDIDKAILLDPDKAEFQRTKARLHNNRGEVRLARGAPAKALADFEAAQKLDPGCAEHPNDRGNALRRLGKSAEALAAYREARALDPSLAYPLYNMGTVYLDLDDFEGALKVFRKSAELDPKDPHARAMEGFTLLQMDRHEDALDALTDALKLDPSIPSARGNRGVVLRLLGKHEEALADLLQVKKAFPNHPFTLCELGYVRACLGESEKARAALDRAVQFSHHPVQTRYDQVTTLWGLERYPEAVHAAEKLCEADRDTYAYWLVSCLRAVGEADKAAKLAGELTGGPRVGDCRFAFAFLCAAAGRGEKARESIGDLVKVEDPFDIFEVARTLAVLGDREGVLRELTRAIEKGYPASRRTFRDPEFAFLWKDAAFRALQD